jgi:histidyl-tRNA synthetase
MSLSTQPYKGARDFYPDDMRIQKYMFSNLRRSVEKYGYQEYNAPILEPLELYAAKSGQEIVNEQTYQFEDRGGRMVVIRPEMTPTVSRMVAARRQELAYPARLYSIPNLWRYERPQRGRLREHWQLNVDIFGVDNISAEVELIQLSRDVLKDLGSTDDMFEIHINSRKLIDKIMLSYLQLDDRASHDLIKLIDKKNKLPVDKFREELKEIVGKKYKEAESLLNIETISELPDTVLGSVPAKQLENLIDLLKQLDINNVVFDINLMRGFDYYTDIVFEVFDTNPTNNRSMFGGGRYDGLVGMFGVEPVATVGFGMGDVTLRNFLETNNLLPALSTETDIIVADISGDISRVNDIASILRKYEINVATDFTGRKIDKVIKAAAKQNCKFIAFIGAEEIETNKISLKNLETGESEKLTVDQVVNRIKDGK